MLQCLLHWQHPLQEHTLWGSTEISKQSPRHGAVAEMEKGGGLAWLPCCEHSYAKQGIIQQMEESLASDKNRQEDESGE